jgi:hypothetical protein
VHRVPGRHIQPNNCRHIQQHMYRLSRGHI